MCLKRKCALKPHIECLADHLGYNVEQREDRDANPHADQTSDAEHEELHAQVARETSSLSTLPIGEELGIKRVYNLIKSPKTNLDKFIARDIKNKDQDSAQSYGFAPSEVEVGTAAD